MMTEPTAAATDDDEATTVRATVARLADLPDGEMRMVEVEGRRVALIRVGDRVNAIDNACPHEGYGLVTGSLDGTVVTCQWHNWKYDVTTGRCLKGEEDVPCHRVEIDPDGGVSVAIAVPSPAQRRERLWPSLVRGIESDYPGQVARDSLRLLDAEATPAGIMAVALAAAAPRVEYGIGHELAMAADCLALAEVRSGDDRLLPLVQGLSGLAEESRGRPAVDRPLPDPGIDLGAAVEAEDEAGAMAATLGLLERGEDPDAIRRRFINTVSHHHLSYGHGIIYTQKTFEVLDRIGWDNAPAILPHLASRYVNATREDTLPYLRRTAAAVAGLDLDELADRPGATETGWWDPSLVDTLLGSPEAPIGAAVDAIRAGAGVEGLLDAVTLAVSRRLLDHDLSGELSADETFGWLDITHGLTAARAARWAWRADPGPHTVRQALWQVWLCHDTGRRERRSGTVPASRAGGHDTAVEDAGLAPTAGGGDGVAVALAEAIAARRADEAAALAAVGPVDEVADTLTAAALDDRAGSFIVLAHLIKTTAAAIDEAGTIGSPLPLAATARYLAAPRLERFVARGVSQAIGVIRTGRPPRR